MRVRSILLAASFIFAFGAQAQEAAQDTTWKTGGVLGATFSQVSLTNWAAGGLSSIAGNGVIGLFANMKKGKNSWDNTLDLGYGLLKNDGGDAVKSDDRIDLASKYGREAWSPTWNYSALLNFRTQFNDGFAINSDSTGATSQSLISDILAPAYVLASLGLDHKPNDNLSIFISPLTAKFTIVNNDDLANAGAFGVTPASFDGVGNMLTPGENTRSEFGGYLKFAYQKQLMENVSFTTKADFFSNYEAPTFIDINWDALLGLKVNEYISTSLGISTIYDHDITITDADGSSGPRTQIKQLLGVGFSYQL